MIDFSLNSDDIVIKDDLELILQQLDIYLDTDLNEVLGYPKFGTNFEIFLYDMTLTNSDIAEHIYSNIINNVNLFDWTLNVNVELLQGSLNDIILVHLKLTSPDNNESYEKVYKIN